MSADQPLIANELLAFLQQKLDVMDEVSAIQICASSFSVNEICSAKELLYRSLKLSGTYVPHRRGDEQGKKTLQDIIKVLKETDPDDVPTFVAKELSKLPPVTFDHVDVTSLLKDIVALKASLADVLLKFEASQSTIDELRIEVKSLRNTAAATRPADASNNVNTRRGAYVNTSTTSSESGPKTPMQQEQPALRSASVAPPPAQPPRRALPPANPPPPLRRRYADAAGQPPAVRRPSAPAPQAAKKGRAPPTSREPLSANVDEGFTLVQKKRKARRQPRKTQCGTAEPELDSGLRSATPNTALYVSRLHHSCTVQDVVEYVHRKSGYTLRVSQLESRHYVHFTSYVVRVPRPLLDTIASADFWPKGVVFRRFRGTLRNTKPEIVLST